MGKIVVSENISLDGVVEDPTGEGGSAHGGWFERYLGHDREAWAKVEFAEALGARALLVGRRSDQYFGSRWNSASGAWPDRLNSLPKYVVSSTLAEPVWMNSTILSGNVVEEASKLRENIEGEIIVYASRQLVQTLIQNDLVDELRLMVFPVVLGAGQRLFGEPGETRPLQLISVRAVGENLALVTYEVATAQ
jgi:dihydrofolate reductase